jgi:hypothetical protein
MPVSQAELTRASQRGILQKSLAARSGQTTAFLCHSHRDKLLAIGLQTLLHEAGWDLYIDWQDSEMPESPDRETAEKIQGRIVLTHWFLFLATENSTRSKWCPWEIGYADGKKADGRIIVVQTTDSSGKHHGNEYLQLYPRITPADVGGLAYFPSGKNTGGTYLTGLR